MQLQQLTAPWFHTFAGTSSELTDFAWSIARNGLADFAVRVVRGTKMPWPIEDSFRQKKEGLRLQTTAEHLDAGFTLGEGPVMSLFLFLLLKK